VRLTAPLTRLSIHRSRNFSPDEWDLKGKSDARLRRDNDDDVSIGLAHLS
jgi:hypothetical protein